MQGAGEGEDLNLGMRGVIHPSSQARSTMAYSMFLIVTGLSTRPATHAPSQGAGHTRPETERCDRLEGGEGGGEATVPVNSGKLLVLWRRSMASLHCFL